MKRLISLLLVLSMVFSMLPLSAFAVDEENTTSKVEKVIEEEMGQPDGKEALTSLDIEGENQEPGEENEEESENIEVRETDTEDTADETEKVENPYALWTDEQILAEYIRLMEDEDYDALDIFLAQLSNKQQAALMEALAAMVEDEPEEQSTVASGTCGANLTWELDTTGVLRISGTGETYNYNYPYGYLHVWTDDRPWHNYYQEIQTIIVEEGVTVLGENVFYNCYNAENIILPESLVTIRDRAFIWCQKINSVYIPKNVSAIGGYVFYECRSLQNIAIPSDVRIIREYTFNSCSSLMNIVIPNGATSICQGAFGYCQNLREISVPSSVISIDSSAFDYCKNLQDVYYSGSEVEWNKIWASEKPECLSNATIHYNSIGPEADTMTGDVRFFSHWDAEKQIAYFGPADLLGSQITGDTKPDFLSHVDEYIGKYVLVETVPRTDGVFVGPDILINVQPVDTNAGTVNVVGADWINIDDTVYGISNSIKDGWWDYSDQFVIFHSLDEQIIEIDLLDEMEGVVEEYDAEKMNISIRISQSEQGLINYSVSPITDNETLEMIFNTEVIGKKVSYFTDRNNLIYRVIDTQSISGTEILGNVSYFSRWDSENQIAYFGADTFLNFGSQITDETSPDLLGTIDEYVGQYVLVDRKARTDGFIAADTLINIEPLSTIMIGTVKEDGGSQVTLDFDGLEYQVSRLEMPMYYQNDELLGFFKDNKLIYVASLACTSNGHISFWDSARNAVTINGVSYPIGEFTDIETMQLLSQRASEVRYCLVQGVVQRLRIAPPQNEIWEQPSFNYNADIVEEVDPAPYLARFRDAYDKYVKVVQKLLDQYTGTAPEPERDAVIAEEAERMRQADLGLSGNGGYLTGGDFSAAYRSGAYKAYAASLYDFTKNHLPDLGEIDLSKRSAAVEMVTGFLQNISEVKKEYDYDGYQYFLSYGDYFGVHFGTITVYKGNKQCDSIIICSTRADCEKVVADYLLELKDLGVNSQKNVVNAVVKDVLGKPLSTLTKDYVDKTAKNIEKKIDTGLTEFFQKAGAGDVLNFLDKCYTYYTWMEELCKSMSEDTIQAKLEALREIKFEDQSVTERAGQDAVKAIKKAVEKTLEDIDKDLKTGKAMGIVPAWKYIVMCPVQVTVLNEAGEIVGYVDDEQAQSSKYVHVSCVGEAKQILSYTVEPLTLLITATDYGTMSCIVEERDDLLNPVGRLNYYDIPLEPEKEFSLTAKRDIKENQQTIVLTSGTEVYHADEFIEATPEYRGAQVSVSVDSNAGTVSGAGRYLQGNMALLSATANQGYSFEGWYQSGTLLSNEVVYELAVRTDIYLTAKFTQDSDVWIAVDAKEGGVVSGGGASTVGASTTVFAFPLSGYRFAGWYDADHLASSERVYTFTVSKNVVLTAAFEATTECDHIWDGGVATVPPTHSQEGELTRVCVLCDQAKTEIIARLENHTFDQEVVDEKYLTSAATCVASATYYKSCICGEVGTETFTYGEKLGHNFTNYVFDNNTTCTEDGTKTAACDRTDCTVTDTITDTGSATGHTEVTDQAVEPTATETGLTEGKHCSVCNEILVAQKVIPAKGEPKSEFSLHTDFTKGATVYIDGIPYTVDGSGNIDLPDANATNMVAYTYRGSEGDDIHTQYPTGMKVWMLKYENGTYTFEYVPEFDDLLQYSGCSIRVTGNKGIRMITSINQSKKSALVGTGLAGYKLVEYGTLLAQTSKLGDNPLVLGGANVKSNYAYKRNMADPVFNTVGNLMQYTNVLVGFTDEQCSEDIAMRPYMIVEDANGEQFTIYGGTVYRSIGYIAYQNRNSFTVGSDAYQYVWSIIHNVYGNAYDSEYRS